MLKSGTILKGEIKKVEEKGITVELESGGMLTISYNDLEPYTAYKLKLRIIKPEDPQEHIRLAEFALTNKLYSIARNEYRRALELDPTLKKQIQQRLAKVTQSEAEDLLQEGLKMVNQERFEEAVRRFGYLIEKYPQSPQAKLAQIELTKVEAIIKDRHLRRMKELEEIKKRLQEERIQQEKAQLKEAFELALTGIETGRKRFGEGLDHEGEINISKAITSYKLALEEFLKASDYLKFIQKKGKDPDILGQAKEKLKQVDHWLVIVYNNLANAYTLTRRFHDAIKWINKALKIDPDDKFATELKLKITACILMR
jgi:tetratricopeptide (TPR) repeat protein